MSNIIEAIRKKQELNSRNKAILTPLKIDITPQTTSISKKENHTEALKMLLNQTILPRLFVDIEEQLIVPNYPQHAILTNFEEKKVEISLVWGNNDFIIERGVSQTIQNNIKKVVVHEEKKEVKHFLSKKVDYETLWTDYVCDYYSIEAMVIKDNIDRENGAIIFKNPGVWMAEISKQPVSKGEPNLFNFSKNNILCSAEYMYRSLGKEHYESNISATYMKTPDPEAEELKKVAIREGMILYDPSGMFFKIIVYKPVWENNISIVTDLVANLFVYPHKNKSHSRYNPKLEDEIRKEGTYFFPGY